MLRRDLLRFGIAAAVVNAVPVRGAAPAAARSSLHLFSKPLQWLDYDALAETAAEAGYGGIELTVRPGGHVEPERVVTDLPRAAAAARKQGLSIGMIVTAIKSADDPAAEPVLKTAAAEGVAVYRMAYLQYDDTLGMDRSLDSLRRQMAALFPESTIYSENIYGLTKSLIAVGGHEDKQHPLSNRRRLRI